MDGWMDEWMNGWMNGWMDEWMDEWMDGWRALPSSPPSAYQEPNKPTLATSDSCVCVKLKTNCVPEVQYHHRPPAPPKTESPGDDSCLLEGHSPCSTYPCELLGHGGPALITAELSGRVERF